MGIKMAIIRYNEHSTNSKHRSLLIKYFIYWFTTLDVLRTNVGNSLQTHKLKNALQCDSKIFTERH
jgi:hypothetical protein